MSNTPQAAIAPQMVDGFATVKVMDAAGMITVRGDFSSDEFKSTVTDATGCAFPEVNSLASKGETHLAWMSPDELMIFCGYEAAPKMAATLQSALSSQHALVCVVSDARALFEIAGSGARDALAKLTPADLSRDAFTVGTFRRTRMAQIPAGIGAMDEDRFLIMCFRSVAEYTFEILKLSAQKGGEVGFHS